MSVKAYLNAKINANVLRQDDMQFKAAQALDKRLSTLKSYTPKRTLFSGSNAPPKGLYLWGNVGRGKSMLMDVFYEELKVQKKQRVHFHAFMQDVHKRIAAWRKLDNKARKKQPNYIRSAGDDPIAPTAKAIADRAHVLCFDEFQVTDITDAMIISRLFSALLGRGVVIIATSNRPPKDLYKDGLNRKLFLPFIKLLKEKLEIFNFAGNEDHRLRKLKRAPVYYYPLDSDADKGIEAAWQRLIRPVKPAITTLNVQGRTLNIQSASGIARSNFNKLCAAALGPADYLAIAQMFGTLILENVPILSPDKRNEAKRFVTLIDALYESRTKLILSAASAPGNLYQNGDGRFEFARTASRLMEMQSVDYLGASHRLITDSL
ncbi:MAG: cell division protein ZapE [Robiginitomaculum sp.]